MPRDAPHLCLLRSRVLAVQLEAYECLLCNELGPLLEPALVVHGEDVLTPTVISIFNCVHYQGHPIFQMISLICHSGATDNLMLQGMTGCC